ncbi:MAG: hypothetical protein ACPGYX_00880 [Oceanobacter sp.]
MRYSQLYRKPIDGGGLIVKSSIKEAIQIMDAFGALLYEGSLLGLHADELYDSLSHALQQTTSVEAIAQLQTSWHQQGLCPPEHFAHQLPVMLSEHCHVNIITNNAELVSKIEPYFYPSPLPGEQLTPLFVWSNDQIEGGFIASNTEFGGWHSRPTNVILALFCVLVDLAYEASSGTVLLHAAGATRDGKTLVMPAVAGSGKSTLAANLLQNGFRILNDDVLPLSPEGKLSCIYQPLKVKQGSWPLAEALFPTLKEAEVFIRDSQIQLKLHRLSQDQHADSQRDYQASCIIVPSYQAGASAQLQALMPTEAMLAFATADFRFVDFSDATLDWFSDWVCQLPAYRIIYGDSAQSMALIEQIVETL